MLVRDKEKQLPKVQLEVDWERIYKAMIACFNSLRYN
jgi:hypothetical protein